MHRLVLDVLERVVHPAHVPLEVEAEASGARGRADAGPRGGLLGDHDDARVVLADRGVELLQQLDGLEVLAAAVDVGQPLVARVVEVEHRRDGVDAQPVEVELLEPVERVGDEEVAHLGTAEVEDVGAPVELLAATRVGVLVEGGAVEAGERPLVLREVGRDPVDDDAEAASVQLVDEEAELVGRAEARRGRVVRRDLVAPRAAERVLRDGQQLHVREAGLLEVVGELGGELAVAEPLAPRPEMDLVDAHGRRLPRRGVATCDPLVVAPRVAGRGDDGGGGRRDLGAERERVGLVAPDAVGAVDLELVAVTDLGALDDALPDATPDGPERVGGSVPAVEVAHRLHLAGVRGPHGERDACVRGMRAQHLPQPLVAALGDEVEVELPDLSARAGAHAGPSSTTRAMDESGMTVQSGRLACS